jgi:hypothetical protein
VYIYRRRKKARKTGGGDRPINDPGQSNDN